MKKEFADIDVESPILITLSRNNNSMEMGADIVRHLKSNIALISIPNTEGKILNFNNVDITVVYTSAEGIPYVWNKCTIVYYQGNYLLQVSAEGGRRFNRRNSFRVGVSRSGRLRVSGHGSVGVLIGNVSLTGFSVTDREKKLNLSMGTSATLVFEDIGHELELEGNVVRIQEEEDYTIYGFVLTKSCRELSSYVTLKQRSKSNN